MDRSWSWWLEHRAAVPGAGPAVALRKEMERFCQHKPPQNRQELQAAYTRRMSLSARLTAIRRADSLIHIHPALKDQILNEVSKFCNGEFADDGESFMELQRRNLELTETISAICVESATT